VDEQPDHEITLGPRWAAPLRAGRRVAGGIPRFLIVWTLYFLFCALLDLLYRRMGWEDLDKESTAFEMLWIGLTQALFFAPGSSRTSSPSRDSVQPGPHSAAGSSRALWLRS
jgi:hypothetical protein